MLFAPKAIAIGVIVCITSVLGGTAWACPGPKIDVTISVPGSAGPMAAPFFGTGLLSTHIFVSAHRPLVATGNGMADFRGSEYPPTGNPQYCPAPADNLAPGIGCGADLLARVGNGPWVAVGYGPTCITGQGRVTLATNDSYYGDNSGAFRIHLVSAHATHGHTNPVHRICGTK